MGAVDDRLRLRPAHRGDRPQLGRLVHRRLLPRTAAISLYGLQSAPGAAELLARLGKHRTGAGCVYVNGLGDIDLSVLRELVALARACEPTGC